MFINKTNGIYERNYLFRANIVEKVFQIRYCIEMFEKETEIYTIDLCALQLIQKSLYNSTLHVCKYTWPVYMYSRHSLNDMACR